MGRLGHLGLHPVWSIAIIEVDLLVIRALVAHGGELRDA